MHAKTSPTIDTTLFRENLLGTSTYDLGERHDMAPETVRLAVVRGGRALIDQIHLDLIASHATGEVPTLVIPDHAGPDHDLALELLEFVVSGLARVGMNVRTIYRPTYNGVVIALVDADPPKKNSKEPSA
jgi:hypothetical protein